MHCPMRMLCIFLSVVSTVDYIIGSQAGKLSCLNRAVYNTKLYIVTGKDPEISMANDIGIFISASGGDETLIPKMKSVDEKTGLASIYTGLPGTGLVCLPET